MQSKLIILRKLNSVTQKKLADFLKITLKTYRNKEQGVSKFTSDEMFALSVYFKKSLDEIFIPTSNQKDEKTISLPN